MIFDDLDQDVVSAFFDYHREHPEIFDAFKREAERRRAAGASHLRAKRIFEDLRDDPGLAKDGQFKVNNRFSGAYSRYLEFVDPSFRGMFEKRRTPGHVPEVSWAGNQRVFA